MPEVVYLNGRLVPPAEAVVSINDRGFLFGDAVYEVISSYGGRLWALDRHLRRLQHSLDGIDLRRVDIAVIQSAIEETYRASELPDALVYLQITRGVAPRAHAFSRDLQPTVLITVRDATGMRDSANPEGVSAVTAPDLRWRRCDIKATTLLPNVLAKTRAHDQGAYEAILVDRDGCVTEGSSTNVLWVEGSRLFVTPGGPEILPGVTQELVVETARQERIPVMAERAVLEFFRRADEIFLTGTITEICPVISVDGVRIGSGRPGPITRRLQQAYRARIAAADDAPR
jgi:D-alanine transaminase